MKKILIVAAMEVELAPFLQKTGVTPRRWCAVGDNEIWVDFTGVGPVAAAFHIQRLVGELSPELVVQAGIAGAYTDSGLAVGDTVQVVRERLADLGILVDGALSDEFSANEAIENPHRFPNLSFPAVAAFTVNLGCSPLVDRLRAAYPADRPAVESMEGYSLFYACKELNVRFLQIRTVSNLVAPGRESWDLARSFERLAVALAGALQNL